MVGYLDDDTLYLDSKLTTVSLLAFGVMDVPLITTLMCLRG